MTRSDRDLPAWLHEPEAAAIDRELYRLFARRAESATEGRILGALAAWLSRAGREGHACGLLDDFSRGTAVEEAPDRETLLAQLEASALAAPAGTPEAAAAPLVFAAEEGRVWFGRSYEAEGLVAAAAARRLACRASDPLRAPTRELLRELFPDAAAGREDRQAEAALAALTGQLTILTGGPGTGKTRTVVRCLVALLSEHPESRIALAAPTGKAAARLSESVAGAREELALSEEVAAALRLEGQTLHRLLGRRPGGGFRHDARRPLPCDVLVVDEASMVDLDLARALFSALSAGTRLFLLGDEHQLASVASGYVLGDLCRAARGGPTPVRDALRAAVFGSEGTKAASWGGVEATRKAADAAPGNAPRLSGHSDYGVPDEDMGGTRNGGDDPSLEPTRSNDGGGHASEPAERATHDGQRPTLVDEAVVRLVRSYRFRDDSGIGRLARALLEADADGLRAALEGDDSVTLVSPGGKPRMVLRRLVATARELAGAAGAPEEALAELERFRILCAHREGPLGVHAIPGLLGVGRERPGEVPPAGTPILVTENEDVTGLRNGDLGVVFGPPERPRVLFPDGAGGYREITPGRLPPHEIAWAMTVHKSQGSEFDEVLCVLPEAESPLATRELVYTAVTRARRRVVLLGSFEALLAAARRPARRTTGLWPRVREELRALEG